MDEASTSSKAADSSDLAAEGTLSSSSSSTAAAAGLSWRPSQGVFGPYLPVVQANASPKSLRVVVRRPIGKTKNFLIEMFKKFRQTLKRKPNKRRNNKEVVAPP